MKIILLGPPGSGKGTQGAIISDVKKVPRVSTGDMLRTSVKEQTSLGKRVEQVMNKLVMVLKLIVGIEIVVVMVQNV